jgi:hypothetical protein
MSQDAEFLANYLPNRLYTHPGKNGTYATIAGEGEEVIGEIDVTVRCKVAVSAFWVQDRSDFGTFKITKLIFHQRYGWREDSHIQVNQFQLAQMKEFLSIISNLNLSEAKKARLSLDNINISALGALIASSKGAELIRELTCTPELHYDIYAVAAKRKALADFEGKLGTSSPEAEWQAFFEAHQWIFRARAPVHLAREGV